MLLPNKTAGTSYRIFWYIRNNVNLNVAYSKHHSMIYNTDLKFACTSLKRVNPILLKICLIFFMQRVALLRIITLIKRRKWMKLNVICKWKAAWQVKCESLPSMHKLRVVIIIMWDRKVQHADDSSCHLSDVLCAVDGCFVFPWERRQICSPFISFRFQNSEKVSVVNTHVA